MRRAMFLLAKLITMPILLIFLGHLVLEECTQRLKTFTSGNKGFVPIQY